LVVPFRIAYLDINEENFGYYLSLVIDVLADIVFGIDIFINFLTAIMKEDGTWEFGYKAIAINYLKGFFIIDVLSIIPFGTIVN